MQVARACALHQIVKLVEHMCDIVAEVVQEPTLGAMLVLADIQNTVRDL
jgi:hypothetical protein